MRILYIFPHPDDESFGPALAIAKQRREGHEVFLLTLTRGGATKQRHRLGLSIAEMGELRVREMEEVRKVLDLNGMTVLDLPDGGLKEMDPREIEGVVCDHIREVSPDVLVSYAVHGISGFHDHLVSHAVVKRVFCVLRDEPGDRAPRRLAHFTLAELEEGEEDPWIRLNTSAADEIDCSEEVSDADVERAHRALACYESYEEVIRKAEPLKRTGRKVHFELFQESHDPRLGSLAEGL